MSYAELDRTSDRVRDRLVRLGVSRGDRVGVCLHKSIDSVAAIMGILKCGAAYVPVDPTAPASRSAYILKDCAVKAAWVEGSIEPSLSSELAGLGASPERLVLDGTGGGLPLHECLDRLDRSDAASSAATVESRPEDLAYILYTSGSTGRPKGVMLSHLNAVSFVEWCAQSFDPRDEDRFSSHAPFHFDLSILDLYTPLKQGATIVLIPEKVGKDPLALAGLIAEARISVWYSTPSILSLLVQYGKLARYDHSALRTVLFAGEVFPVAHLRALVEEWPHASYFNLYGPTETNVCTYHPIPLPIPVERAEPFPIGRVCSQLEGMVVDEHGQEVPSGAEGELCIRGPNVMQGYWNLREETQRAFLTGEGAAGWYRTGDLVVDAGDGVLRYVGRRDRMVKRRGYRVELGEIEACLYRHPEVFEIGTVAHHSPEEGLRITAHIASADGKRLSVVAMKQFCARHLPAYMVPDRFRFHASLPKTSTDKTDYQSLEKLG